MTTFRRGRGQRINPNHADDVIKRIQTSQIINRLQDHVFGKVELTRTQVMAASVLLRKRLPDMAAIDMSGTVEHKHYAVADTPELSPDEWQKQHAPPPTLQ